MKWFKKLKNKFNKYKTVTDDVQDIKCNLQTIAGSIRDIYENLGEAKWDILELKNKVKDMEEQCP
jgi:peptidoglycan hydrolase CwlO-like protein